MSHILTVKFVSGEDILPLENTLTHFSCLKTAHSPPSNSHQNTRLCSPILFGPLNLSVRNIDILTIMDLNILIFLEILHNFPKPKAKIEPYKVILLTQIDIFNDMYLDIMDIGKI